MALKEIKPRIFEVGVAHWDRVIFDDLIPLPDGTSYNVYVIKGSDKTAVVDSVDPEVVHRLKQNLKLANVEKVDYIISNHAEQDHSGSIPELLKMFPDAKVVTNKKCKAFLEDLLHIPDEKFLVVADYEKLSLGDKNLEFIMTPWVHWPETMVTYLHEDKILFSCDFFGSHVASSSVLVQDEYKTIEGAKRYFAEIMMPFRKSIKKNIEKLNAFDIAMIAPSHGPIWQNPQIIIDAYEDWISEKVTNTVLLPYVSMHGSTLEMVEYLTDALIAKGIAVQVFNLTTTDIGKLAIELVDAATIVLGSPTVLAGPHPSAAYAAFLVNALRPKTKHISIVGSYGWASKTVEQLAGLISNLKVEILTPVLAKGKPRAEDFAKLDILAEQIAEKHKGLNLL